MLNFEFSDEQKMIRESVRDFAKNELAPNVRKMDTDGRIPESIISGLANLGVLGMTAPSEIGGQDADPVTAGIVAEELARGDIGCATPTFFLVQAAWGHVFAKYGDKKLLKEVFPKVTQGRGFIGIASTEPDCGSDVSAIKTIAKKNGKKWILNGEKMFISGVGEITKQLPDGGGYVAVVKTDPSKGAKGISLMYIPIKGVKGVTPTILEDWGRRGISTGGFALEDVELPENYLIGEENKGFYLAMQGFDYARAIISLVCCGAAMSCLEQAMEYLKIRKAFGTPIARYEGIQFPLAENWSKLEAARLLGYNALWAYGKELKGEGTRKETTKLCAMAKTVAVPLAFEAINDAIQWFGAFGYTTECPLELSLRAVRSYYWAEGSREIMRIIVGRELLGKEFVATR